MKKTKLIKRIGKAASAGLAVFAFAMLLPHAESGTHAAQDVDFSVTLEPSIQVVIPADTIMLELVPKVGVPVFTSQDFKVVVATNNITGYNLTLSAGSTTLQRTAANAEGVIPTLETLDAKEGGYTAGDDFTVNRWGYKIGDGNYLPFETSIELAGATGPTNGDQTDFTFGAKVDMTQDAGVYKLGLNFIAVANPIPEPPYLQDYTLAQCSTEAVDAPVTLTDKRDMKEYTVRYINGNCWMTQNLAYDLTGVTQLSEVDTDVTGTVAFSATDSMDYSYTDPYYHIYTESERNGLSEQELGILYNYAAASAGTIKNDPSTDSSTAEAESSICPKGWKLPTYAQTQSLTPNEIETWNYDKTYETEFSPVASGSFGSGSVSGVGYYGLFWSSTASDEYNRYYLEYEAGSGLMSGYDNGRDGGLSVRCVAR